MEIIVYQRNRRLKACVAGKMPAIINASRRLALIYRANGTLAFRRHR
jgi:hypothetical protein